MSLLEKVTHCVTCNAPLSEEDMGEGFETCVECDLAGNDHDDDDDDDPA